MIYLIIIMMLVLLTACGNSNSHHDPEVFHVSFISSVPTTITDEMESYITDVLAEELPEGVSVNVNMFLPSHDRLTIEMIDRQADVIIVDEGLEQLMLDAYYLTPVDEFSDRLDETLSPYTTLDERTNEEHLYLLPLRSNSAFRQAIGYELPGDLVLGIVESSPHQVLSKRLIEDWL